MAFYVNGVFLGYRNQDFNQIYLVTNNQWNWLVNSGLDVSIAKQGGRVQWLASYSHQWRHVAGTWVPNDPASFIQPDAFPNDKGIGNTRGPLTTPVESNSLSGTYMAGSGQWRENVASLSGSASPLLSFFGSAALVEPGGETFHHHDVAGFGSFAHDLLRFVASAGTVKLGDQRQDG